MHELLVPHNETWNLSYPNAEAFAVDPNLVTRAMDGNFSHERIDKFCANVDQTPSLLLDDAVLQRLTEDGTYLVSDVEFTPQDGWEIGRTDSLHQVEFGILQLTASNGRSMQLNVAVKPYHAWRKGASNELAGLMKAKQLTGIETFEPIGILNNGTKIATITRFEGNVISLDNRDWYLEVDRPLNESFDIIEAMQKSALTLARLHQNGIIHNDAQIKNMAVAVAPDKTEVRLIDLEQAKWRDASDPIERQRYLDGVHNDVSALVSSILSRGLWRNAGYEDKARAIELLFTEPYKAYLKHPGNQCLLFEDPELPEDIEDRVDSILEDI